MRFDGICSDVPVPIISQPYVADLYSAERPTGPRRKERTKMAQTSFVPRCDISRCTAIGNPDRATDSVNGAEEKVERSIVIGPTSTRAWGNEASHSFHPFYTQAYR